MSARRFRARRPWCALLVVPLVGCGASSKPEVMAPQGAPAEAMVAPAAAAPAAAAMADETPAASPGVAPAAQASVPSAVQPSAVPQAPPPGPHAPQAPATATPAKGTTGAETRARSAKEIAPAKGMVEQRIIFTGTLDVEVEGEAIGKTLHDVIDIAVERGGYIGQQTDQSVTVRVPSASFREALREIEKLGEVLHRSVQAQDVSEEFHDIEVRLQNLLATRKRIESFLDRAASIDEVLRIEQELGRLNAEIDRLNGRLRFLAARAAFSTITVTLRAKAKPVVVVDQPPPPPPPPPPPRTLDLPIDWLGDVTLDGLLRLESDDD